MEGWWVEGWWAGGRGAGGRGAGGWGEVDKGDQEYIYCDGHGEMPRIVGSYIIHRKRI